MNKPSTWNVAYALSIVLYLRDEGYIEVVVLYGEDGGQICNEYRLAEHRN